MKFTQHANVVFLRHFRGKRGRKCKCLQRCALIPWGRGMTGGWRMKISKNNYHFENNVRKNQGKGKTGYLSLNLMTLNWLILPCWPSPRRVQGWKHEDALGNLLKYSLKLYPWTFCSFRTSRALEWAFFKIYLWGSDNGKRFFFFFWSFWGHAHGLWRFPG